MVLSAIKYVRSGLNLVRQVEPLRAAMVSAWVLAATICSLPGLEVL